MNHKKQDAPLSILLAEDDPDDRFFFEKVLKEIPIATSLTVVHDGEQLMYYLSKNLDNLPAILFLDLSMPHKTGFECLIEIKENEKLEDIAIIVFTTSFVRGLDFEPSLINILSKIGAQEYIRKPGDFKQRKRIIHETLHNYKKKLTDR